MLQGSGPRPEVIHETDMVRLWHRPDPSFRVPKAVLYMHLHLAGETGAPACVCCLSKHSGTCAAGMAGMHAACCA